MDSTVDEEFEEGIRRHREVLVLRGQDGGEASPDLYLVYHLSVHIISRPEIDRRPGKSWRR